MSLIRVHSLIFSRCCWTKASEDTGSNKKGRTILPQFIIAYSHINPGSHLQYFKKASSENDAVHNWKKEIYAYVYHKKILKNNEWSIWLDKLALANSSPSNYSGTLIVIQTCWIGIWARLWRDPWFNWTAFSGSFSFSLLFSLRLFWC